MHSGDKLPCDQIGLSQVAMNHEDIIPSIRDFSIFIALSDKFEKSGIPDISRGFSSLEQILTFAYMYVNDKLITQHI